MLKKTIPLLIPFLVSCQKIDLAAYLKIDSFSVINSGQGETTLDAEIPDAWIYIDDNLIGAFELPCKIPINVSGKHKITIKPGIYFNGLNTLRGTYLFYSPFETETIIDQGQTIAIQPQTKYMKGITFPYFADFDNQNHSIVPTTKSDSAQIQITENPQITSGNKGGSLQIKFDSNQGFLEFMLKDDYTFFPKQGSPIYLEMDYSSSHEFQIVLESYYPSKGIVFTPVIKLNQSAKWKKVYVLLTEKINLDGNTDKQRVLFSLIKKIDSGPVNLMLDNIRIVHFKT